MTGNVAQVFVDDDKWAATLDSALGALRPGGYVVFETRDPARQDGGGGTRRRRAGRLELAGAGVVETWTELSSVHLPLASFRHVLSLAVDEATLVSESTLRFRDRAEIERSLVAAGFEDIEVRDARNRLGLELVFVYRRSGLSSERVEAVEQTGGIDLARRR